MIVVAILLLVVGASRSDEGHTHAGPVGRFYQTWKMPDNPNVSCCHDQDCSPAASKFENGHWSARRNDNEAWIDIPAKKIEQNRDTPDGRSHLCGRRSLSEFTVFCFVRGGGA
jgi:hypothetical protein